MDIDYCWGASRARRGVAFLWCLFTPPCGGGAHCPRAWHEAGGRRPTEARAEGSPGRPLRPCSCFASDQLPAPDGAAPARCSVTSWRSRPRWLRAQGFTLVRELPGECTQPCGTLPWTTRPAGGRAEAAFRRPEDAPITSTASCWKSGRRGASTAPTCSSASAIDRPRSHLYVAMEYVDGQTPAQADGRPLGPSLDRVRGIVVDIGDGAAGPAPPRCCTRTPPSTAPAPAKDHDLFSISCRGPR